MLLMGKLTISMAMFNSYVNVYQRVNGRCSCTPAQCTKRGRSEKMIPQDLARTCAGQSERSLAAERTGFLGTSIWPRRIDPVLNLIGFPGLFNIRGMEFVYYVSD